jgi:histidinol phosphatase-like enzyme
MAFGSEVYVLTLSASKSQHVSQKLEAYTRQVIKFLESAKIKYQRSTAFGDNPADMTLEYATKVKADLIAIMTEKVSALTNLFFGVMPIS